MFSIPFLDLPPLCAAHGSVALPGSKSISNRALLLAALCEGQSTELHGLLDSDDTEAMLGALQALGCRIERLDVPSGAPPGAPGALRITALHGLLDSDDTEAMLGALQALGCRIERLDAPPGAPGALRITALRRAALPQSAELHLGNAGTAMRPLTAALALLAGAGQQFTLTGVARMQERPIGDLVDALRQLGADVAYTGREGYPPLRIGAAQAGAQGEGPLCVRIRGDVSSQFLTAMLMALPLAAQQRDCCIEVVGELISQPYIAITLNLMQRFGVVVANEGWQRFTIAAGSRYQSPGCLDVEADASSASYFIALGGIACDPAQGQSLTIQGVGEDSIQGDIRFVEAARQMGVQVQAGPNWLKVQRGQWPLQAIDIDANHIPDAAMTLAVMALYAQGTTRIRNIGSWRVKETDRIAAMAAELTKLGAQVDSGTDWIAITPPADAGQWRAATIATYDDHRMAMCFSLAAFNPARLPVRIQEPRCVGKTFPEYFETLFSVVQAQPGAVPVICIDGPSASGKGTLAAQVAQRLGYAVLDSGALYRAAGLAARHAGLTIEPAHAQALAALARGMALVFEGERIWLDGQDVSDAIRSDAASRDASLISALPEVRQALLDWQHQAARAPGLVADGRDMGTVVFPQAQLKVFLTASAEKRAERRYKQLISKGFTATLADLRAELEERDRRDATRPVAPLAAAADALMLDNSELSISAATEQVLRWWEQRQPFAASA